MEKVMEIGIFLSHGTFCSEYLGLVSQDRAYRLYFN